MAVTRLDMAPGHTPFVVTATLRGGASWDQPYGLDLAGIVAAHQRRVERQRREDAGDPRPLADTAEEVVYDMQLPLARCLTSRRWHWAATCAISIAADDEPEPRTFYRTTDSAWSERAATRPLPYFSPKSGPYRDVMMAAPATICAAITWRAIGDVAAVRAAVEPIRFIGRRRNVGEGRVLAWTVQEQAPTDLARWLHLGDDDTTILRPCPVECMSALGADYRMGWYALRPPSWHPDHLAELAMTPDADDESWFD